MKIGFPLSAFAWLANFVGLTGDLTSESAEGRKKRKGVIRKRCGKWLYRVDLAVGHGGGDSRLGLHWLLGLRFLKVGASTYPTCF